MSEERLNEIEEAVKRMVFLADVNGGFTSQNIKFIELWNYTMKLQKENEELKEEIKRVDERNKELVKICQEFDDEIKKYEDPEDLTLMFMYCDEKAKDKLKELEKELNNKESVK